MPVQRCQKDGKPGFKWGKQGFCYVYKKGSDQSRDAARKKAAAQGRAINARRGNAR